MFKDKLKKLIGNEENAEEPKNQKKKIENLIFFIVILIITIIAINLIWNDSSKEKENQTDETKKLATSQKNNNNETIETSQATNELEEKLENILSTIQGVGEVHIFINYSESSEVIPMYNENSKTSTTEETDTSGGTRKIQETDSQKDIIYQEDNGEKTPMTQKIVDPKIEGAIVTAKGANDANVKTSIVQAVEAVTGLPTHKIQVFELNS